MATTRDDVARAAKVSPAVVSYVLNNGPRPVAASTRRRVLDAIRDLDYQPNALARGLRRASTNVLGLILPDISNPFFAELALAVENAAFDRGYTLFLGNSMHRPERQAVYLQAFAEQQVAGLCLIADRSVAAFASESLPSLQRSSMPIVLLDRLPVDFKASSFVVDNANGAFEATMHLLEHGHRSVACVAGPRDLSVSEDRTEGWRRAHATLRRRPGPLVHCPFDRLEADRVVTRLLGGPKRPKALFVQSDEQAIGALRAAVTAGLNVPEDLAVVSFDGIAESSLTIPPLTTIQQPFQDAGRRAVNRLIEHLGDPNLEPTSETLPVTLAIRGSCGC